MGSEGDVQHGRVVPATSIPYNVSNVCVCVELTLLLLLMTPNTAITELFTNSTLSGTHQLVWCLGSSKAHCVGGTPLGWSHCL